MDSAREALVQFAMLRQDTGGDIEPIEEGTKIAEQLRRELDAATEKSEDTIKGLREELESLTLAHQREMQALQEESSAALSEQKKSLEERMRTAMKEKDKAFTKAMVSTTSGNLATLNSVKGDFEARINALNMTNQRLSEELNWRRSHSGELSNGSARDAEGAESDNDDDFEDCVEELESP